MQGDFPPFSRAEIILLELGLEALSVQAKASTQAGIAILECLGKLEYYATLLSAPPRLVDLPGQPPSS